MNAIKNKKIAIVGGGPGGLTLARLLQQSGADVTVYERDVSRQVRVQGATLDLHEESGLAALRKAGLMDAFRANYRPGADRVRITDKTATILFEDGFADRGQYSRPEIDRGPLRNILLDSLEPGTVIWDRQFVSLEREPVPGQSLSPGEEPGPIRLFFSNGQMATADIVVAADGASSKIRPYLTPIRPFFAGVTAIEGSVYEAEKAVPEISRLLNGGKIFALDDAKTLIVSSKGDGSLQFYSGMVTEEDWVRNSGIDFSSNASLLTWFRSAFAGWDELWEELFKKASSFIPRPQYCMPFDQTWEATPDLTILGDAAHLMPPYAGEGVNMAMLDALELADCLTSGRFENSWAAIAAFEEQMRLRASEMARMTMAQTALLHSKEGLENLLDMFKGH